MTIPELRALLEKSVCPWKDLVTEINHTEDSCAWCAGRRDALSALDGMALVLEEDAKNAERYRWLRITAEVPTFTEPDTKSGWRVGKCSANLLMCYRQFDLDAAIDAARAGGGK